jgi:hydroxyethylthiazole kinase-like uncharacterized protein yjeF
MQTLTKEKIRTLFKPRKVNSHKGNHSHALLAAGNYGMMGAALIAGRACLRSGVGLLTINCPNEERFIVQISLPEALFCPRELVIPPLDTYSAIGIGPGFGAGPESLTFLSGLIKNYPKPLLLDADALTLLSTNKHLIHSLVPDSIITPHAKEFDRLFGEHPDSDSRRSRRTVAIQKAAEHRLIIVLKGPETLVTDGSQTFINSTGNAGLAQGGSGDALSGIITSFLAQGYSQFSAALIGVYLHGLAADYSLETESMESLLITDVISNLGKEFMALHR